jgi:hypothetical protein
MAPPVFGRSVNPISTKAGRLCPPNDTGTPGFSDRSMALILYFFFSKFWCYDYLNAKSICKRRGVIYQEVFTKLLFHFANLSIQKL